MEMITTVMQIRKQRLKNIKLYASFHISTSGKWQNEDLNPAWSGSKAHARSYYLSLQQRPRLAPGNSRHEGQGESR